MCPMPSEAASWAAEQSFCCPAAGEVTWVEMGDCVEAASNASFTRYAVVVVFAFYLYNLYNSIYM